MIVSEIELFSLLKTKLGEQEAKALVEFVEAKAESKVREFNEANLKTIATKSDIMQLEIKISETKVDIIKWLVGIAITLGGLVIAVAKFVK